MLHISATKQVMIWLTVVVGLFLALPNGFYTQVERYNDAVALGDEATGWPSFMPSGLVNLGLDLRGGAHLLAEVKVEDAQISLVEALWPEVRRALSAEMATIGPFRQSADAPVGTIRIQFQETKGIDRAYEIVRGLARPVQSLTGVGASDIEVTRGTNAITVQLSEAEKANINERTMQQSLEIIRRRIDEVGTREPTIQRQGADRILVQVPGVGSAQEVKDIIGTTAQLTFQPVVSVVGDADGIAGAGNEILPEVTEDGIEPSIFYVLERNPVVTGEELNDARPEFDQNGQPAVGFRFNPSGAKKFGVHTTENAGSLFAIVLDGEVISAPRINEPITGGSGIITGNFTIEESTNLAVLLRAGALPAELEFLEERTIGPELGQDSIDAGKIACIVAGIAVLVYMFLSYGLFGVFANAALIINVGLIFGLLSLIGATLTLPGIAGIVLTIGMAVDANVIVFERIREELKTAKGPARAIELGYQKALSSILDANVTTFITATILFVMGSGPVRGFAITLGLGIMTSVFTAIFVTRALIAIWFARRRPKTIEV
ncbi:protein translocase subunit SecD [Cognatiyoonia sp.]|uniref:protein translocase subunit SecD n=1 Tax=Cognatiyoonia sp. TaxID=2211652 RepID=UPI003F698984